MRAAAFGWKLINARSSLPVCRCITIALRTPPLKRMRWCSLLSQALPCKRTLHVRLAVRCVRCGATNGAMPKGGWRRGRRRISAKRLRRIEQMKSQGMSNRAIAHKLGVTEKAIRKQVGPTRGAASGQLALPGIRPPKKSAATAPPASSTGGDNDDDDDPGGKRSSSAASPPAAANDDEPVPKSLDRDASNRTLDRQLAYLGLLKDAAPLFRDGSSIPGTGVLLALPCLVESGLFQISRKLYGEIGPAFYGLRTTLLTLLLMALLRIKRPEHLKERDPAAFGRLLGLDRAPEVKTLRRRLTRLAAHHCAEQLGAELARLRVDQRGHLMGFLYVDGHVRAYHGQRAISSNAYVARRHLAMPACTDYWINDSSGDPLLVITGEVDAALTKAMPGLLREVREVVGERRVTIVFDRGGWSPKLFAAMIKDGFDVLTYRKGHCRRVNERRFVRSRAVLDGCSIDYLLHDQPVRFLQGKLRLRQVTRLCDGGHQTSASSRRIQPTPSPIRSAALWTRRSMRPAPMWPGWNVNSVPPPRTIPNSAGRPCGASRSPIAGSATSCAAPAPA